MPLTPSTKTLATSIKRMLWTVLSLLLFKRTGLKPEDQIRTTPRWDHRKFKNSLKNIRNAVTTEVVLITVTTKWIMAYQKPHTRGHT